MAKANVLIGLAEMAEFLSIGYRAMMKLAKEREENGCPVHEFNKAWRADPVKLEAWYKTHLEAVTARRHPELRRHMRPDL